MPVNAQIGDYVSFVTIMTAGTVYVDNFLLVDAQDAVIYEQTEEGAVMQKIASIGTVTLDSAQRIAAAREAYETLTEEQKALVTNYETLVAAEKALKELQEADLPGFSGFLMLNETIDLNVLIPEGVETKGNVVSVKFADDTDAPYTIVDTVYGALAQKYANPDANDLANRYVSADQRATLTGYPWPES